MSDRWKELPIPKSARHSLQEAFEYLPYFLSKSADDDEVVDFTQNSGWRKIDKLFPLLRGLSRLTGWMQSLSQYTAKMKVSDLPSFKAATAIVSLLV